VPSPQQPRSHSDRNIEGLSVSQRELSKVQHCCFRINIPEANQSVNDFGNPKCRQRGALIGNK